MVRMVEGEDPGVEGLATMVDGLADEADRFQAHVDLAMLRGLLAAGDGGDWMAPMLELRQRLDGRAGGPSGGCGCRWWRCSPSVPCSSPPAPTRSGPWSATPPVWARLDHQSGQHQSHREPPRAVPAPNFDVIVSLAKRRGFVFPSSEIYGGMAGFWDYGTLGVDLQ